MVSTGPIPRAVTNRDHPLLISEEASSVAPLTDQVRRLHVVDEAGIWLEPLNLPTVSETTANSRCVARAWRGNFLLSTALSAVARGMVVCR